MIILEQRDSGTRVALSETCSIVVAQPAIEHDPSRVSIPSNIQEKIAERILLALRFGTRVLDHMNSASGSVTSLLPLPRSEPDPCRGAPDKNRTETPSGQQWAFLVETGSKPPCPYLRASGPRCQVTPNAWPRTSRCASATDDTKTSSTPQRHAPAISVLSCCRMLLSLRGPRRPVRQSEML